MPFTRLEQIEGAPAPFGVGVRSGWAHHSERTSTAIVRIAAGGRLPAHYHREHDEIITLVEGELDFRLGDETRRLTPGTVVSVPCGTVHGVPAAITDCVLVAVFSPTFDPLAPDRHFVEE